MIQFSDTTNKNGLIQLCEIFTGFGDGGISGDTTRLKQFTMLINNWYGTVVADILDADGRWQFDDTNHTKQPVATFDLVQDQALYNFLVDEQSNQILRLGYVTVKDASGNWIDLRPMDISSFASGHNVAYDEFNETSGTPALFDISDGTGVKLSPAPNYNSTNGGKVYFQREASFFASTDTTKKPGFASPFHIILAKGASSDYGIAKSKSNAIALKQEVELLRQACREFYSRRNKFEQPKMTGVRHSSR